MAYREKLAWMTILTMGAVFSGYLAWVKLVGDETRPMPNFEMMKAYAVTAVAWGSLYVLGRFLLRRGAPADARAKPDERDLAVDRRATQIAYYFMMGFILYIGGYMPFVSEGWQMVNAAIFSVVLAEIIRCVVTVVGYRRSAA
jgi:hypothetical protein